MIEELAQKLVTRGLVAHEDLALAYRNKQSNGGSLALNLVLLGAIDEEALASFYAEQYRMPRAAPGQLGTVTLETFQLLPIEIIYDTGIIPLAMVGDEKLAVGVVDPAEPEKLEEAEFFAGYALDARVITVTQMADAFERLARQPWKAPAAVLKQRQLERARRTALDQELRGLFGEMTAMEPALESAMRASPTKHIAAISIEPSVGASSPTIDLPPAARKPATPVPPAAAVVIEPAATGAPALVLGASARRSGEAAPPDRIVELPATARKGATPPPVPQAESEWDDAAKTTVARSRSAPPPLPAALPAGASAKAAKKASRPRPPRGPQPPPVIGDATVSDAAAPARVESEGPKVIVSQSLVGIPVPQKGDAANRTLPWSARVRPPARPSDGAGPAATPEAVAEIFAASAAFTSELRGATEEPAGSPDPPERGIDDSNDDWEEVPTGLRRAETQRSGTTGAQPAAAQERSGSRPSAGSPRSAELVPVFPSARARRVSEEPEVPTRLAEISGFGTQSGGFRLAPAPQGDRPEAALNTGRHPVTPMSQTSIGDRIPLLTPTPIPTVGTESDELRGRFGALSELVTGLGTATSATAAAFRAARLAVSEAPDRDAVAREIVESLSMVYGNVFVLSPRLPRLIVRDASLQRGDPARVVGGLIEIKEGGVWHKLVESGLAFLGRIPDGDPLRLLAGHALGGLTLAIPVMLNRRTAIVTVFDSGSGDHLASPGEHADALQQTLSQALRRLILLRKRSLRSV